MEPYSCSGNIKEILTYLFLKKYKIKRTIFNPETNGTVFFMDRPIKESGLDKLKKQFDLAGEDGEEETVTLTANNSPDKIIITVVESASEVFFSFML